MELEELHNLGQHNVKYTNMTTVEEEDFITPLPNLPDVDVEIINHSESPDDIINIINIAVDEDNDVGTIRLEDEDTIEKVPSDAEDSNDDEIHLIFFDEEQIYVVD